MGVYIKGMEMPKCCAECKMYVEDIYCCHLLHREIENPWADDGVELDCPLVLVPPHGRLIEEADAIETAWMILRGLGYLKEENPQLEKTVREVFATAPAIEVE